MNLKNKLLGIGAVTLFGVLGVDLYRSQPDETCRVKLDDRRVVSVHRWNKNGWTDVETNYKNWIVDKDGDLIPDFRRTRTCSPNPAYDETKDYVLSSADRKDFEEAVTKAGLKR